MAGIVKFRVVGAVGVLDVQGGFSDITASGGRVGHAGEGVIVCIGQRCGKVLRGISHAGAIVQLHQLAVLFHQEHQGRIVRFHGDHLAGYLGYLDGIVGEFLGFPRLGGQGGDKQGGRQQEGFSHVV